MELDFEFYGFLRRPLRKLFKFICCKKIEKIPKAKIYKTNKNKFDI